MSIDLKKIRLEKGYTQLQVARSVGVSIYAYQQWERKVMKPTEENLIRLKKVLGIKE